MGAMQTVPTASCQARCCTMNYVVTAHKPTAVTHSVVGHFTSATDLNLVVACVPQPPSAESPRRVWVRGSRRRQASCSGVVRWPVMQWTAHEQRSDSRRQRRYTFETIPPLAASREEAAEAPLEEVVHGWMWRMPGC